MRKTFLTLLVSVLAITTNYSQMKNSSEYSYKISEPYKVFDARNKVYFSKGNEVMAVKLDREEILIQKFDSNKPAFIKETKYEKIFPRNYSFEEILEINNKYYLFYSSWDGDAEKEQLFFREINFEKGEFSPESKLLFQVEGKIAGTLMSSGMGFSHSVEDKFDFYQSNDKSKLLIQYRKKPEVKRDTKSYDIIGLHSYDKSLNKLYSNEVTMPYTERRMENLDYQLDSKGNLYMLEKIYHDDSADEKKRKKDEEANYHIELLTVKAGTDKINISKYENTNKFVNNLWILDTNKDQLICGGFYSEIAKGKSDYDDIDGVALIKFDSQGKTIYSTFQPIPLEIINQYESNRTRRRNEKKERKGDDPQFRNLVFRDMVLNPDGSVVLIGEQNYIINNYIQGVNGSPGGNYYTYHYCNILVTKLKADGSLAWMKKIPKNQMGFKGRGGMSYKYFSANNKHYLVFLDNIKNIDLPLDKEPTLHKDEKGGYLTSVKIDDVTGEWSKGAILNSKEVKDFKIYQFSVNGIIQIAKSAFMFEVYKKRKEDVMIKVDLN
ncbi:hypothetical protein BZL53_07755 [Flavobacterium columnare]|uniref:hypothetical protein n=1 Tax=Flavobacterium columnare TaxID=996 RepID=UPI0009CF23CA|nr:hypothetical protein [Flavobacterium columnare]OOB82843.1 hypothetical protein BZL53_07755 [Flavobacterium columnare]